MAEAVTGLPGALIASSAAAAVLLALRALRPDRPKPDAVKATEQVADELSASKTAVDRPVLVDDVTVLLTTSPAPSHPSTALLERVVESFSLVPDLMHARKIIVFDKERAHIQAAGKCRYRSGRVDEGAKSRYEEYKAAVKVLADRAAGQWNRTELLELDEHQGFGFAVKQALDHVHTSHVLVVQHDRTFMRPVALAAVLETMRSGERDLGYVLLPTTSTSNYSRTMNSWLRTHGVRDDIERIAVPLCDGGLTAAMADGEKKDSAGLGPRLLPCLRWFDSTHLANTEWYRSFVFDWRRGLVKKGGFIEDKFGQKQAKDIAARGLDAHADWNCWLLEDGLGRAVGHLDGSNYTGKFALPPDGTAGPSTGKEHALSSLYISTDAKKQM